MVDRTDGDASEVPLIEPLDETESLRLISTGGVGRIGFTGRFGPAVLPVNYKVHDGTIVFRTVLGSPMDEDLRTGIAGAEYQVAFEVDEIDMAAREGWSVLIQGSAHHVDSAAERTALIEAGVQAWPGGDREVFIRIIPRHVTGRRIRHVGRSAGT
jgi:nitroimidazol reductase NimA-like FMN-containing flavoprotein (pyridoxamine 5'-phosphate oxidase superfamily)